MTTISVENLPAISHENIPVITTEVLANLYGAKAKNISDNYLNNISRFVAGKHFFKLEKEGLREFKNRPDNFGLVGSRARSLILWTERGAARHAKMLETDQAWEVFEKLEDCYFNQKRNTPHPDLFDGNIPITVTVPREGRWLVFYRNGRHELINIDGKNCVDSDYIQKVRRDISLLQGLLHDFGKRTLVLSGDASGKILDNPLTK